MKRYFSMFKFLNLTNKNAAAPRRRYSIKSIIKNSNIKYFLIFLMSIWHASAFAEIETRVEPTKANLGDSIRVIYSVQSASSVNPDLSPLKKEFNILGTQQSMSYSVVNGQAHALNQWIILLSAKQTGKLTIPSIQIGQDHSKPVQIDIVEQDGNAGNDNASPSSESLFLKTDVSNAEPYLSEQVIFTVKVYHNQRLVDAEYQPPSIEHALLFPLGDGQSYQSVYNGQVYAVEEQQYAIFPQKSGSLKLVAPTFQALIYNDQPERVKALAKTTELHVKPIPATYQGKQWFPAKQVKLTEVYSNQDVTVIEGSTLVRTVTLQAIGVPAQLLPALTFTANDKLKVYPEKPDVDNAIRQKELVSKTIVKATYLFNQSGEVDIPELSMTWFNTVTGQEEKATLPARHFEVRANATGSSPSQDKSEAVQDTAQQPIVTAQSQLNLGWIIAGMLAIGWLLTIVIWLFSHQLISGKRHQRMALKRLQHACMNNQPIEARAALIQWAKHHWPDVTILNITDLSRIVHDAALKKQLLLLSHALYSQDGKISWRGDALWHSVVNHRATKMVRKNKGNPLPPINPF